MYSINRNVIGKRVNYLGLKGEVFLRKKDKHTHIALDDAMEQGKLFINMMKEHLSK